MSFSRTIFGQFFVNFFGQLLESIELPPRVACTEPPHPPLENHLVRHYGGGETTPFGLGANYTCEHGFFFEEDYNQTHFSLECFKNGTFEVPQVWPRCRHPSGNTSTIKVIRGTVHIQGVKCCGGVSG